MPDVSMPSLSGGSFGAQQVTVAVESDPPGADAKASAGGACRTPCSLSLQASGDFTISVSLNGYLPKSVPVKVLPPEDPRFAAEGAAQGARVDPNPVFVELEKAPPPPAPPAKKRPAKKPATARAPAAATAAAAAPAPTATTAQPAQGQSQSQSQSAPWPMPR
jgi:hypothetical protein